MSQAMCNDSNYQLAVSVTAECPIGATYYEACGCPAWDISEWVVEEREDGVKVRGDISLVREFIREYPECGESFVVVDPNLHIEMNFVGQVKNVCDILAYIISRRDSHIEGIAANMGDGEYLIYMSLNGSGFSSGVYDWIEDKVYARYYM